MPRTLVLVFHRDLSASRANAALAKAAGALDTVDLVDMYALYPHGDIDTDQEVARLLSADRLVLQFPVQWYSTPALLKSWQDAVLTRMFYLFPEQEGRRLAGKQLLVAATAGNVPQAYAKGGANLFPLADLLRPLEATANRCGLIWQKPFLVFRADKLGDSDLADACRLYAERLAGSFETEARDERGKPRPACPSRKPLPASFELATCATPVMVLSQMLLAGLAMRSDAGLWDVHALLGALIALPISMMALLSWRRHGAARPLRWWSGALGLLYLAQVALMSDGTPSLLSAFHPFNAGLVLVASLVIVGKIWKMRDHGPLRRARAQPAAG